LERLKLTDDLHELHYCPGMASRWDFIQGEVAMQRRMANSNRCSASRNYRRKLQKRLMHHKQQLEDLEAAKKAFHASTQV
jgi:baculoviral IAP repeat-containing protein 6